MALHQRLKKKELERLESLLAKAHENGGMNLEEVDGYFTALFCIPDHVPLSEFIPMISGNTEDSFGLDVRETRELAHKLPAFYAMRKADCHRCEFKVEPILRSDAYGAITGKSWCGSFLQCLNIFDYMSVFSEDEDSSIVLVPLLALAEGKIPLDESGLVSAPVTPEQREGLLQALPTCIYGISLMLSDSFRNDYDETGEQHTIGTKISRNASCPCGSGKKFKKCCLS